MANVNIFRGGTPDFKGYFCEGQYAEFNPPFDAPNLAGTPPWDSHADAAYGQGYLNLHFPLVPNLADTYAHSWMQNALKGLSAVGDVIFTNWVPMWSFLDSYCIVVKTTDKNLDGVYVTPVAYRVAWDFTTQKWTWTPVAAFAAEMSANGINQLPLGTPQTGDKVYGMARLYALNSTTVTASGTVNGSGPAVDVTATAANAMNLPSTFGHPLVKRDTTGKATGPLDANFGAVVIGLQVSAGTPAKIETIWRSNIAVYTSAKLLAFEGATQVG